VPGAESSQDSPAEAREGLHDPLVEARREGFLGPGPLDVHLRHAAGFAEVARRLHSGTAGPGARPQTSEAPGPRIVDLGSGGGLPGLVVAAAWTEAQLVLLDANARRTAFLRRAVNRLGLAARVSVVQERAERYGRLHDVRGTFDGALARSFGRPAVVAECAAPLLRRGGWLVVSEPPAQEPVSPTAAPRWPAEGLLQLGLVPVGTAREGFDYQVLQQAQPCPERFARRDGVPTKRPLF
jgi:16S rRNA (guanine527-N7)-methyltransferase